MWLAVCIAAFLMHSEATETEGLNSLVSRRGKKSSRTMTLQEEETLEYPSMMEGK